MARQNRFFREVEREGDALSHETLRATILEAVRSAYSAVGEDADALADYLLRDVMRREARGISRGTAVLSMWDDLERLSIKIDGTSHSLLAFDFLTDTERCGLDLRGAMQFLTALRDTLARTLKGEALLIAFQETAGPLGGIFHAKADGSWTAVRNDPDGVRLALSIALDGHVLRHPGEHLALLQEDAPASAPLPLRTAFTLCLLAVGHFLESAVKPGHIKALARYYHCLGCLLAHSSMVMAGTLSRELTSDLAEHADWLMRFQITDPLKLLKYFEMHGRPCTLRDYYQMVTDVQDVITPEGLDTLFAYSSDPRVITRAAVAIREHHLTLAWLVSKYQEVRDQTPFTQWVEMVARFGEKAPGILQRIGTGASAFLAACDQIGTSGAITIAQRVQPADASRYVQIHALKVAHPHTEIRALHEYLASGMTETQISTRITTRARFGVPDEFLSRVQSGNDNPERLALRWHFQEALAREPQPWEYAMLAQSEFLDSAKRFGLKRALRKDAEWNERVQHNRVQANARQNDTGAFAPPITAPTPHTVSKPKILQSWARPPRNSPEQRLWVAWRIVRTLAAKGKFGKVNANEDDIRKDVPRDLGTEFSGVWTALIKDEVILLRPGQYTRASLNPVQLARIDEIRAGRCPSETALARFVNEAKSS